MIQKLAQQLAEMESMIPMAETQNSGISHASAGWHLAHNILVINQVTSAIAKSDPVNYKPRFSWTKFIIFLTKNIPRGKAKAPKAVEPTPDMDLQEALERASLAIINLMSVAPNQFFPHPYFGDLNRDKTIKFLWIHTEHHLKIVRDLLKK
ncbi:DUF1569 domain-containing protein [Aquirufa sp. OSTEICH-129V]|jgi:hypothetical protein|uniref:DUF1569 domain-containing protein n=1 Tax=Aquirufa avitistagni TaxID=3104728 RepID=A0ABW6DCB6_9BACT